MTDQPPLPKRIAWFAPWTWKRRWWVLSGLLLVVGYPLSLGPVFWVVERNVLPHPVAQALEYFYLPLLTLGYVSESLANLLHWYLAFFVTM